MTYKGKMANSAKRHRDLIIVAVPILLASALLIYPFVPPDQLAYFADAYTIALLFILVLYAVTGYTTREW